MTPEFVILAVAAALVVTYGLVYRRSANAFWNPLRMAMTLTAVFLFYFGAAVAGYTVPAQLSSLHQIHNVGHIVWQQAGFGLALGLLSIPMWWLGLKRMSRG